MKQYDFINDPESGDENAVVVNDAPRRKLDIWPRIICLFIAIGVWLYMVNLNDTDVPSTVTLRISVQGADELRDEKNMLIYGIDKTEITVTVKGSNRDLNKYTELDYSAVVDVSGLSEAGRHTLPIEIITPSGSSISVSNSEPLSVVLYSDESLTKTVPFDYVSNGIYTVMGYDYKIEKNTDSLEISGPKSIIDTIAEAKYTIKDREFYTSKTYTGFSDVEFFDKNGAALSYDKGMVLYSTTNVMVSVNVSTSKIVPISVNLMGGSNLVAKTTPEYVTIVGDPAELQKIDAYVINLSPSQAYEGRDMLVTITGDQFPTGVTVEGEGSNILIAFSTPQS